MALSGDSKNIFRKIFLNIQILIMNKLLGHYSTI